LAKSDADRTSGTRYRNSLNEMSDSGNEAVFQRAQPR